MIYHLQTALVISYIYNNQKQDFVQDLSQKIMSKPDFVEFQQSLSDTSTVELQSPMKFRQVNEFNDLQRISKKKSHAMRKKKTIQSTEDLDYSKKLKSVANFPISILLVNLLRDPQVNNHEFEQNYLLKIQQNLKSIEENSSSSVKREYILYIHLILCQVENFECLQQQINFKGQIVQLNHEVWNGTNIMNPKCIIANLQNLVKENHKNQTKNQAQNKNQILNKSNTQTKNRNQSKIINQPKNSNQAKIIENNHVKAQLSDNKIEISKQMISICNDLTQFYINIVEESQNCLIVDNELKISKNYIDIALNSHGHWDIYFAPLLLQCFEAGLVYRYLFVQQNQQSLFSNYSKIFIQICHEYMSSSNTLNQNWYQNQLQKLINEEFSINQIEQLVYSGIKNSDLERLLIGLLGWKQNNDKAVQLLNSYYNSNDWQSNDITKPTICQCGQNFTINYLIQNSKHRQKLIFCLKAPCFNSLYNHYFFSFHKPKINQFYADQVSYLWVQNPFGQFKKSGFYDWILYFANPQGKQVVNKIIDIKQNQKIGSQIFLKNVLNMKNVKGRYIIHPQRSRQMQIHQVFIDSITSDQGLYKNPTFIDVIKQVQILKNNGVNTIYLSGVFQRDNGEFQHGFKRPQASSAAITNRIQPSSLLGGQKQFKKLIHYMKSNGLKLIVDCFTRVSSSRMSKKYEGLKLMYIDEKGRKNYFYGSEGRAINYEQTAILNYRKKQSWDLLLQEITQLIQKYQIDGIHLDNGHVCPQIYEIDKQQLSRLQNGKLLYTHQQIFQGDVINPKKKSGYWASKATNYPNPFFVYLTENIWTKYPHFSFISQIYETQNTFKFINAIQSGFIPRLFKLPKALSQIVGVHIHENGELSQTGKKPLTKLVKWYQQTKRILPKNSILIQSTTNHIYPYPASIFKKATWAFIDLFFFLPEIPMTFSKQHLGRAYRTKALNMFVDNQISDSSIKTDVTDLNKVNASKKASILGANSTSYSVLNSTFFQQQAPLKKKQKISTFSNTTLRDPSQIKHLQQNFRKQVGPQFGFDLAQIHRHYQHRRQLRQKYNLLCTHRMISLSAQHLYGVHTSVISFAKYDDKQILLVSINFNETAIDMHYNLAPLKNLFSNPNNNDLIIKIQDILNPNKFVQQYYSVGQLLSSKIQENIKAYSSSLWKLSVIEYNQQLIKKVFVCSRKRIAQRISRNPPQWIYSSIFTNQLSKLIIQSKSLNPFVNGLNKLYNQFILPLNLNFNLVISKSHDLFLHKVKLQKLFGILKLLQRNQNKEYFELFQPTLRTYIQNLLKGNELGPIAFVTPQIGAWSSVGGLGVMVDELSKQLVRLKQTVYILTPYYQYNKKKETGYLARDGFHYQRNIKISQAHLEHQFGIHRGVYQGVNYIWFHNPQLFSRPYDGEGAIFVTKQIVFFALISLQSFCQLQIFPSIVVTNDWMCGFVSAYVKVQKYKQVFNGTRFMHIVHNLDPLYEGRLYPKYQDGDLNWLVQLPREWYLQYFSNKMIINPSKCALQTCDNWGTVSHSYKIDLLKQSPLSDILWKHPHAFSFPNGVRKDQRLSIIHSKTPGDHFHCKKLLQNKYFGCQSLRDDVPLFAFIGRVTKQKGVHLIIDAAQALLYQTNFKIQFLIGGPSDSKQQYGKYCSERMKYLTYKYPQCFWSNPDSFFTDGALVNVGSDYAMMPSLFEPGGIVQHQFFCGSTPVIAFRTGGLKDTVFQYDPKSKKGNGFNFMSYDVEDFKRCMRRAISCYKNKQGYQKLRQNAFDSVIQEADVARGWNSQFYRLQNKIYIDWDKVEKQIQSFTQTKKQTQSNQSVEVLKFQKGEFWRKDWQIKKGFKQVLKGASRLGVKTHLFCFETDIIPRPKQVMISGSWNDWKHPAKMNFEKIQKNWKITLKLKPGTYIYKYIVDGQWMLTKDQQLETDQNNIKNHIVIVQ